MFKIRLKISCSHVKNYTKFNLDIFLFKFDTK